MIASPVMFSIINFQHDRSRLNDYCSAKLEDKLLRDQNPISPVSIAKVSESVQDILLNQIGLKLSD